MNTLKHALTLAAAAAILSGCKPSKPVLHIFTWADYVKPELVQQFEQEHGCRVMIDTFDSNEAMYNKLKAGATGYDLIVPSSYYVDIMFQQGMLQPIQHALIPNLKYIDQQYMRFATDAACAHSVPYMMCNAGIAYRTDKVTNVTPTWAMFDRADLKGRMTLLKDMRETIGAALKFLGYSLNTTNDVELERAKDIVIRWKKNLAKFESEQYKNGIASGEFLLTHGYGGDILQVMNENTNVAYVLPAEGVSISCDHLVIPKDAGNVALAHAFINFIHEPKAAAANTAFIQYLCPNTGAYPLLSKEITENTTIFLPLELRQKSEAIKDLGANNTKYTRVWDLILAAE